MEQESDIQIASLSNLSSARLPLCIPWSRTMKAVRLGTTFHSRLSATFDPWSKACPFLDIAAMPILYTNDDGGQATYISAKSTSAGSNLEHLSMSLGLSVGCSFLGASVTGKYDKDVLENSDVCYARDLDDGRTLLMMSDRLRKRQLKEHIVRER
jgi:hypothetical protein